jgi:hypothetical protein
MKITPRKRNNFQTEEIKFEPGDEALVTLAPQQFLRIQFHLLD